MRSRKGGRVAVSILGPRLIFRPPRKFVNGRPWWCARQDRFWFFGHGPAPTNSLTNAEAAERACTSRDAVVGQARQLAVVGQARRHHRPVNGMSSLSYVASLARSSLGQACPTTANQAGLRAGFQRGVHCFEALSRSLKQPLAKEWQQNARKPLGVVKAANLRLLFQ